MPCELCETINEPRVVQENTHAFAIICKDPLKDAHVIVLPKRHIASLEQFSADEAKDFLLLIEEIKWMINKKSGEDVLVTQNSGHHSTEHHIHFHVFPSKGGTRDLVSAFEHIPVRHARSMNELTNFAEELKK